MLLLEGPGFESQLDPRYFFCGYFSLSHLFWLCYLPAIYAKFEIYGI